MSGSGQPNDPNAGIVDWNHEMRRQKEMHFWREHNGGADGGSSDRPGGPCQEAHRNLMDQLFNRK